MTDTILLWLTCPNHPLDQRALLGWADRSGGGGANAALQSRLRLHYVAMTRPARLLCLALREDAFDAGEIERLMNRGWRIARVWLAGPNWLEAGGPGAMTQPGNLVDTLDEVLPHIDRSLADQDVAITDRPLQAAIAFAESFVEAVQDKGAPAAPPGDRRDFLVSHWFALLYADVAQWYGKRFPGVIGQPRDDRIFGIVLIAGTVFPIRVPAVRTRAGSTPETRWVSFPDGMREGERAFDWIETPPNFAMLSPEEQKEAETFAEDVAGKLRFIRAGLMGVSGGDTKLDGFKAGVMPHLRRAAELLLESDRQSVQHSYWELQLASEMALKALSQQRVGAFRETHDLFRLYDDVNEPAQPFDRDLLKRIPRWGEMMELRYGQGSRQSRAECVSCYRDTLAVVSGAVRSMEKLGVGNAEFEIGQPPWMKIQ